VTVNGALKIKTLEAGNGIIHVINKVLIPEPESNIMQVLERKGNFSTLLTALAITGLTPTIQNGQYRIKCYCDKRICNILAKIESF
jgi:uncharacterized surface protein with fasciclin (FAS1) repeats